MDFSGTVHLKACHEHRFWVARRSHKSVPNIIALNTTHLKPKSFTHRY